MTSKKRSGIDPEQRIGTSEAMGKESTLSDIPGRYRGSSEAYMAGRRAMAKELYESGGFNSGRLALEILYLLPDDFVSFYTDLFHRALAGAGGESVMAGRNGGVEKSSGRTSMQLGSKDRGPQAGGSGKKWKNLGLVVADEDALDVKIAVDKGLRDLMRMAVGDLRKREAGKRKVRMEELQGPGGGRKAEQSERRGESKGQREVRGTVRCSGVGCGRFMNVTWKWCPECGTKREG